MNREELIKEFDKQQLEILLNDLQDIDNFTGFKDGAFKYELRKYQASLLVDCIKKQKEVIDKAIEYSDDWLFNVGGMGACMDYKDIKEILDILKEVE